MNCWRFISIANAMCNPQTRGEGPVTWTPRIGRKPHDHAFKTCGRCL